MAKRSYRGGANYSPNSAAFVPPLSFRKRSFHLCYLRCLLFSHRIVPAKVLQHYLRQPTHAIFGDKFGHFLVAMGSGGAYSASTPGDMKID